MYSNQGFPPQGMPAVIPPSQNLNQYPPNCQQNTCIPPNQQQFPPDSNCEKCHGSGVKTKKDGSTKKCKCVKRKEKEFKKANRTDAEKEADRLKKEEKKKKKEEKKKLKKEKKKEKKNKDGSSSSDSSSSD